MTSTHRKWGAISPTNEQYLGEYSDVVRRLERHALGRDIVTALLAGATFQSAAEAGRVSVNVVGTVARNLNALGRWLA